MNGDDLPTTVGAAMRTIAAECAKARADERAAICAWLRDPTQRDAIAQQVATMLAGDIERGDHLPAEREAK